MIPCTCIDDTNRPNEIPIPKWVKKGEEYRIVEIALCLPQNVLSFSLYEKPLDVDCLPYKYFQSHRFAVKDEDMPALFEMLEACSELSGEGIQELVDNVIKEGNLQVV